MKKNSLPNRKAAPVEAILDFLDPCGDDSEENIDKLRSLLVDIQYYCDAEGIKFDDVVTEAATTYQSETLISKALKRLDR